MSGAADGRSAVELEGGELEQSTSKKSAKKAKIRGFFQSCRLIAAAEENVVGDMEDAWITD